jgi:hypothetical protein
LRTQNRHHLNRHAGPTSHLGLLAIHSERDRRQETAPFILRRQKQRTAARWAQLTGGAALRWRMAVAEWQEARVRAWAASARPSTAGGSSVVFAVAGEGNGVEASENGRLPARWLMTMEEKWRGASTGPSASSSSHGSARGGP